MYNETEEYDLKKKDVKPNLLILVTENRKCYLNRYSNRKSGCSIQWSHSLTCATKINNT